MLGSLFGTTSIPVLEQLADFAQSRHEVLAGNIANLDTPGYRTRDLSPELFARRLQRALEERDRSGAQSASPGGAQPTLADASQRIQDILRHDDTNVGLEQQVAEIVKNQARHNLTLSLLSSQFRLLHAAISERA